MDTCDKCGKTAELYHNEATGLAYCDACETASHEPYATTSISLAQLEADAAAQKITCAGLALDREYPARLLALAAALDTAIQYEHTARTYDIETLRTQAREVRAGVYELAKHVDRELATS